MASSRVICITCDSCGREIVSDEFENIPEARMEAKQRGWLVVRRVKNGSLWDFCKSCIETYTDGAVA